jgi:hypothetical protein
LGTVLFFIHEQKMMLIEMVESLEPIDGPEITGAGKIEANYAAIVHGGGGSCARCVASPVAGRA